MIGTLIQNYQVTSLLGEGGMGKVYMATDTLLGRTVAIKNLHNTLTYQPAFLERFKNEARVLARLSHPNIALLYNYLQKDEDYYMVMEYVEGQNLDQLIRDKGALAYQVVVPVIRQALEGLDHAHRKGIFHRDIKPANVMLTPDNTVKLMDFGIAKVSDAAKLTRASRVIGTIEYLAPELVEGREPTVSSDIYAIGVTMYEMLTGQLPFSGKSDYKLMQDIIKEKPINLQKLNASVPKHLSEIVLKALDKKPEKRFQTAKELSQALQLSFPGLKEIDQKYFAIKEIAATKIISNDKHIKGKILPTSIINLADTNAANAKKPNVFSIPTSALSFFKNKYLYIVAASLVFIFILFKILKQPGSAPENTALNNQQQPVVEQVTNSTKPENQLSDNTTGGSQIINTNSNEKQPIQPVDNNFSNILSEKKAEEKKLKKPGNKETSSTTPKPSIKPEPVPKPEPEPFVTPATPVNLRTAAILSLRENITPKTAQDGQQVSFKVNEPVEMKGQLVIPAGAVIHGYIKKIGKIRMDIIFNSVSTRGRSMKMDRSESSANIRDVLSPGNSFKIGLRGTLSQ